MAAILYGARATNLTTSDLYTVDPNTGLATSIGPIGFAVTGLAWDETTTTLFGATSSSSAADPNSLITIDTDTGAGTLVNAFDNAGVTDITVDYLGRLYGVSTSSDLYLIDKVTAAQTLLGSCDARGGLAFDQSGALWLGGDDVSQGGELFRIDPVDGHTLLDAPFTGYDSGSGNGRFGAFTFDASNVLFGADNRRDATPPNVDLVTVTTPGAVVSFVGLIDVTGLEALAWNVAAGPPPPFTGGRFVWVGTSEAIAGTYKTTMVSDDGGETWESVESSFDNPNGPGSFGGFGLARIADITVGAGENDFAVGDDTNYVQATVSPDDGDTWTPTPDDITSPILANGRGQGVFAAEALNKVVLLCIGAVPSPSLAIGTLSGGSFSWEAKASPIDDGVGGDGLYRGCYSASLGRMVAAGANINGSSIIYSDDGGDTWTEASTPLSSGQPVYDITWIEELELFVAAADADDVVLTSPDGITFTGHGTTGVGATCVAWSAEQGKVAVGLFNTDVLFTDDPTQDVNDWTSVSTPLDNEIRGITYGGQRWVLTGQASDGGLVATSQDLVVWTEQPSPYDNVGTALGQYLLFIAPPPPTPVPHRRFVGALWRIIVTSIASRTLSDLDRKATGRQFLFTLNGPAYHTGQVASDDPEINIPFPNADSPALMTHNRRLLYALRYEMGADPPYVCRFGGIITNFEDQGADTPTSRYTAYDPWQYLMSRPIRGPGTDLALAGEEGITFPAGTRASDIASFFLAATEAVDGETHIDFSDDSLIEDTEPLADAITFDAGLSVGEAWQQLVATGTIDIYLPPLYDPINKPGKVCQFQTAIRLGETRFNIVMGWDTGGRSLQGVNRLVDGTRMANRVKYWAGLQPAPLQSDAGSIAAYGEWWAQQFFPGGTNIGLVELMALAELQIRKNGARSINLDPAPERTELVLRAYGLGDYLPVWASRNLREPLAIDYDSFDPDFPGASGYHRVFAIPVELDDNGVELTRGIATTSEQTSA